VPEIVAMVLADVAGFGGLNEDQIPWFVRHFFGLVANTVRAEDGLLTVDTRGDGLYLVYSTLQGAARCSLDLRDAVRRTNWADKALPAELKLRISLHAGPAYRHFDPVTRRLSYTGAQVTYAARIEPITPENTVYASEPFVALAALEADNPLRFRYVGKLTLPKNYGEFPLYLVDRRDD
jgi:class 3 adenylate cyclase